MSAFSSTEDLCAHCSCALVYKCWKSFNQEQQTKMLYHDSDIGVLFQFNCFFNLYISGLLLSWLKIIHSRKQIKSQSYICNNNTWSSCTCLKWSLIFYQPWFCIAKRQSLQNMPITRHTYAETEIMNKFIVSEIWKILSTFDSSSCLNFWDKLPSVFTDYHRILTAVNILSLVWHKTTISEHLVKIKYLTQCSWSTRPAS